VGFEIVGPVQNARRADMLIAVNDFASRLRAAGPDAVGFLYYSGHGIAAEGENYLIPADIEEPSAEQLRVHGVKQSEILSTLRHEAPCNKALDPWFPVVSYDGSRGDVMGGAAHYLVFDACRNALKLGRGIGKGFIAIGQQSGVLLAFSTAPGQTATDVGQGSGPYAAALSSELLRPGQTDLIMFHNVRIAVIEKTRGEQVPWTEDGIERRDRIEFGRAS